MTGWLTVVTMVALQLGLAVVLVRAAARRRRDYLVIAALALFLMRPVLNAFTGDVSYHLPPAAFSDGADGKNQIASASALSTVLLPVVLAAAIVCVVNWGLRSWTKGRPDRRAE